MRACALIAIKRRPAALEAAVLFLPHRKKLPTNPIICCGVAKLGSASAMAHDSDKDKDKDKDKIQRRNALVPRSHTRTNTATTSLEML